MNWEEGQSMAKSKLVQLFVEGKSDETFFEGSKFKEYSMSFGYSIRVKNLKTKGNVTINFEKYLKIYTKDSFSNILIYDRDCKDFNTEKLDAIIKGYKKTYRCMAFQELEVWFLANHTEIKIIKSDAKLS